MQADSFGSQHMTLARNCHVNRIVRLVGKSLELGRRLITEYGARPGQSTAAHSRTLRPGFPVKVA